MFWGDKRDGRLRRATAWRGHLTRVGTPALLAQRRALARSLAGGMDSRARALSRGGAPAAAAKQPRLCGRENEERESERERDYFLETRGLRVEKVG